jgi:hypothetical protein
MKKIFTLLFAVSLTVSNLFALLVYDPLIDVIGTTGSVLCNDLRLIYNLPDSLKTGYSYTVEVKNDLVTHEMTTSYVFTPTITSVFTTEIKTDLSSEFLPMIGFTEENKFWINTITVKVADKISSFKLKFEPHQKCFQIEKVCEEVTYLQKQIQYHTSCGTTKGYRLYPRVTGDSLIVESETIPILTVCVDQNFNVDVDKVVFKSLKNLNYKVILQVDGTYTTFHQFTLDSIPTQTAPIIFYPGIKYYSLIGSADLRECLVDGLNSKFDKQTFIFPNPTENELNINDFSGELRLTNQAGSQFVIDGNQSFDVSDLPKGLYIVQFELNGQLRQEKVIIR